VQPGDELILWLEAQAGRLPHGLAVELWRGEQLRDRWTWQLVRGASLSQALRLRWGEAGTSSRLTCRVLIDGREVARRTALMAPGAFDAQGRFADDPSAQRASPATLLAFGDELQRQLRGHAQRREK
jgi:hypothetical protein